jgi:transcriptional regulator with XRE-family HTH domain
MRGDKSVGRKLRKARRRAGMSVQDVAFKLRRNAMTIYRWEWAFNRITVNDLRAFAELYGVSASYLVEPDADTDDASSVCDEDEAPAA